METYQLRNIEFNQLLELAGWTVKVYTITHRESFGEHAVLRNAVAQLPRWLAESTALKFPTHSAAFLIVHEGRDGVWTLIHWWIANEMLQGHTYFTSFDNRLQFVRFPQTGAMACVWELAVISFERAAWIEHILRKADCPDFAGYFNQHLHAKI